MRAIQIKQIFIIISLSLISGCAKRRGSYIPHLRPLTSYLDYQHTKHPVTLRAQKLTLEQSKEFFGTRAKRLFKTSRSRKPIYPIQLSITNHSNIPIELKPENISLPLVPHKIVASRVAHNTFLHIFGTVLASLVIGGTLLATGAFALSASGVFAFLLGTNSLFVAGPLLIGGVGAVAVTPFFLVIGTPVSSTLQGIKISQENESRSKALQELALDPKISLVVRPHTTVETLIFVYKKDYQSFQVTISNRLFEIDI